MLENTDPKFELKPNRLYKCGCVCLTPSTQETEKYICPACLTKLVDQQK